MLALKITEYNSRMQSAKRYDVAVIGAGVFGVWIA
jgi:cation diffusion facilitator CzcD-associated flavoprotein CzcO